MKKLIIILASIILVTCITTNTVRSIPEETGDIQRAPRSAPFSRGVNFSAWFESYSAQSIPFTRYTEQDFINVKSLGADVIRLPVRMHSMTGGAPNYTIDPLLFRFLDQAIDWAEKHELYIIIDNHSFDPVRATDDNIDRILLPVWEQIARRYRNRSHFVIYEILNEPHGISDERWGEIQGRAIDTIRQFDQNRLIIVGGTEYNSLGKLFALPRYTDKNLIYTFHFYDPHLFTHQGATWGEPSLGNLSGVPFPAREGRMPRFPSELRGTWVEGAFYDYANAARPSRLSGALDGAVSFAIERDVPVFCGEFGVYLINSPKADRVVWYDFVTRLLNTRNISWTMWDYFGGFGLFNTEQWGDFNSDLNVDVVAALGFTPPVQVEKELMPLASGFSLFDDYPNRDLIIGFWGENTDFSLYDTNTTFGDFSIRWGNALRYNVFYFGFGRNGDLSQLFNNGYALEFRARTTKAVNFDVRFVNDESSSSIPWRMTYTINENLLPADGRWHTIKIPFSQMQDVGAWVIATQSWMPSRGAFSWANIARLEFVAEYSDMDGTTVWFDEIKITR